MGICENAFQLNSLTKSVLKLCKPQVNISFNNNRGQYSTESKRDEKYSKGAGVWVEEEEDKEERENREDKEERESGIESGIKSEQLCVDHIVNQAGA